MIWHALPSQVSRSAFPPADRDHHLVVSRTGARNGLHVVTVWQSKAHKERYEAEQFLPVFEEFGMAVAGDPPIPGSARLAADHPA